MYIKKATYIDLIKILYVHCTSVKALLSSIVLSSIKMFQNKVMISRGREKFKLYCWKGGGVEGKLSLVVGVGTDRWDKIIPIKSHSNIIIKKSSNIFTLLSPKKIVPLHTMYLSAFSIFVLKKM